MSVPLTSPYTTDPRIQTILDTLVSYANGDYRHRFTLSENGDEIDAVMLGLNTMAEELVSTRQQSRDYQQRIERVMEVLLKYTMLDFSDTLELSEANDEIDAVALGLNTMAEELQVARRIEAEQMHRLSERKEQIEVILNNAPNAVVVVDEDANVLRWNSRAEEVFGWIAAEIENRHLGEFIVPEKNSGLKKGMEYFLMTGKDPILNRSVEIPALRKDGKEFPVEIVVSSARAEGKQIYIAFINDISERKRNERQLIDANLSLETSNKELEAFTYSVSHDLRAPLRAISGYSQLLVDRFKDKLDGQALAFINSIASNTKRMGRLIDDLLALSKFNRADIVRTEIDTNELVKAVIEEIGKSSDITKTTFRIHDLPRCHADYNLLVQVFINLISNAVKYSSLKDNPQVEIGAEEKDGETIFFIKDNGSGFDMKFYDKLFGVFQRLHDSAEFEGTGVGLAIVKRVISKHGGRVWAESVLNEGTVFYFTLNP